MNCIKYRSDPQPVAGDEKRFVVAIINGECELPVEAAEAFFAPFFVRVNNHLGIGSSPETVPFILQLRSQFYIIKNLPVEGNPDIPVFVGKGLRTCGEIDNRQPGLGQNASIVEVGPEFVRAAMSNDIYHAAQQLSIGRRLPPEIKISRYSAHETGPCRRR